MPRPSWNRRWDRNGRDPDASKAVPEVPFEFLKRADPSQVITFIQDEHPQTIALILAHLQPDIAATVLSSLNPDAHGRGVAHRDHGPTPRRSCAKWGVLERKMASVFSQGSPCRRRQEVAGILNRIRRATEKIMAGSRNATGTGR